eukprot:8450695-Pyramimonas_sp.AAC.1
MNVKKRLQPKSFAEASSSSAPLGFAAAEGLRVLTTADPEHWTPTRGDVHAGLALPPLRVACPVGVCPCDQVDDVPRRGGLGHPRAQVPRALQVPNQPLEDFA